MFSVSAEIMAEIDEIARTQYGISQEYLMERAGFAVASAILNDLNGENNKKILVVCGKGNNGGDGLVAARHIFAVFGGGVSLYTHTAADIRPGASSLNFKRAESLGIPIRDIFSFTEDIPSSVDDFVVVDALLGTGYRGAMTGLYGDIAEKVNSMKVRVYSVDVPSGLNATTGEVLGKCFKCFRTITFGLPKTGFLKGRGPEFCGRIDVADIGFPKDLLERFSEF